MKNSKKILIIDDEKSILQSLEILLKIEGYDVTTASNARYALSLIENNKFNLIISDIKMPEMTGLDFLRHYKAKYINEYSQAHLPIILMTAYSDVKTAVSAIKEGSFDYIIKPFDTEEFKIIIKKALDYFSVYDELYNLKKHLTGDIRLSGGIIGNSQIIKNLIDEINRLAKGFNTILITGESGTGKELAAKLIHEVYFKNLISSGEPSKNIMGQFVPINLVAIPENLIESELFGYAKGAFTGADHDKTGLLKYANKGTVFIDEIGDLPLPVQVKLLRVFQEKTYRMLGSNKEETIDARFIAATNKDLNEMIKTGKFREDLYFRLNAVHIKMPPLRDYKDDIPILASHFTNKFCSQLDKNILSINPEAISLLMAYDYPGNVRELEHIIERACIYSRTDELTTRCLPDNIISGQPNQKDIGQEDIKHDQYILKIINIFNELNSKDSLSLQEFIKNIEKGIILDSVKNKNYSKKTLAKNLGLSPRSLRYIISKWT
jgi:DNA-binding NtrC family response regulator